MFGSESDPNIAFLCGVAHTLRGRAGRTECDAEGFDGVRWGRVTINKFWELRPRS
jgi:hypothetical protein